MRADKDRMSKEENTYTELELYSKPMDPYDVPAIEPVSRANATFSTANTKSSCCSKLLVIATIVNFIFVLIMQQCSFCLLCLYTSWQTV